MKKPCLLKTGAVLFALFSTALAAPVTQNIKMDYFGYRPSDVKVAIFTADPGATVQIRNSSDAVVFTIPTNGGSITSMGADGQPSGDTIWQVNFTGFTAAGNYRLYVPAWNQQSYDFKLDANVYNEVGKVALKTFYYQRCGVPHPQPFADGRWSDPYVCHGYLTATTPAAQQPNYGTLDLSGGWHDAGDYNKYVWGDLFLAMNMLMIAYENNPAVWGDGQLTIPGGGNGVPDILDEIKVEIDWLLKMQRPGGEVLSRVWDDYGGAPDSCPPSRAVHNHHYYGADVDSTSIFVASLARFARICQGRGDPYGNVATLKQKAILSWNNVLSQGDSTMKCWAAAELWRLDQTITTAKTYVENFYPDWGTAFHEGYSAATHGAYSYIRTPGANPTIVSRMKTGIGVTVDEYFVWRGPYRNSMRDAYYHWGSNKCRGSWGVLLLEAVNLAATGSHTISECLELAQDFLHHFHGQNAMGMTYLSNMAQYGGEHSSFQFFHSWFGAIKDPESVAWYRGLPQGVTEPLFPYFVGVDNYGVNDNNASLYGPAPGFVPGGPNKDYSGLATPPNGATFFERFYRDWIDDSPRGWSRTKTWEVNENSISYQGPYVALIAGFMSPWNGVADTVQPSAPSGLTATPVNSSRINLDWSNNTESDIFGYNIYRSSSSGGPYSLAYAGATDSAYADIGLTAATTYYYVVTAVDRSGNESVASSQVGATTPSSAGTMHVLKIPNGAQKGSNPGRWIDIYIVDNNNVAVANATVTISVSGFDKQTNQNVTETKTGVTGSAGSVRLISIVDSAASACVTSVTHATLVYDAGQNVVTCANW